ncbi:MAG: SRPBCC family protein [Bacteroidia bacterium]
MKYSVEIEIEKPIAEVVKLYENPDNLDKWMKGLQSMTPISGEPGAKGSKTKFKFLMGKREIEMTETILENNLPQLFSCSYQADNVFNIVNTSFHAISENKTRCTNNSEFQFKGFMKLIAFLMPSAFKKQSLTYLQDFKKFAEAS